VDFRNSRSEREADAHAITVLQPKYLSPQERGGVMHPVTDEGEHALCIRSRMKASMPQERGGVVHPVTEEGEHASRVSRGAEGAREGSRSGGGWGGGIGWHAGFSLFDRGQFLKGISRAKRRIADIVGKFRHASCNCLYKSVCFIYA
jgi:hypothetical protein